MNEVKVVFCQGAEWAQARGEKVQPVAFCLSVLGTGNVTVNECKGTFLDNFIDYRIIFICAFLKMFKYLGCV